MYLIPVILAAIGVMLAATAAGVRSIAERRGKAIHKPLVPRTGDKSSRAE